MKLNKQLLTHVISMSLFGACSTQIVSAADLPTTGSIPFSVFDLDANGSITQEEFTHVQTAHMKARPNMPAFSYFDVNTDGQISSQELLAGQQKRKTGNQAKRGRGKPPTFSEFDLNKDNQITEQEFLKSQIERIRQRAKAGYPMRNIGNRAAFSAVDADGNGYISPDEFSAQQQRHQREMMP